MLFNNKNISSNVMRKNFELIISIEVFVKWGHFWACISSGFYVLIKPIETCLGQEIFFT